MSGNYICIVCHQTAHYRFHILLCSRSANNLFHQCVHRHMYHDIVVCAGESGWLAAHYHGFTTQTGTVYSLATSWFNATFNNEYVWIDMQRAHCNSPHCIHHLAFMPQCCHSMLMLFMQPEKMLVFRVAINNQPNMYQRWLSNYCKLCFVHNGIEMIGCNTPMPPNCVFGANICHQT